MNKKTLKDIDVKNKVVLARGDFNVPIKRRSEVGGRKSEILDDFKIRKSLRTINYLVEKNAKVVLMSHLDRPGGKVVEDLRLNPIAVRLSELLNRNVKKLDDCVGEKVKKVIDQADFGDIILLENVRFYPEEKKNDPEFAKELASLGEVFVMDGFGVAHREQASVSGVAKFLPAVAGFLLENEIDVLTKIVEDPDRPYVAVLGGAKIRTKLELINKLLKKADYVLVSGALVNTILFIKGIDIGSSKINKELLSDIKKIIDNNKLILPVDLAVGKNNGDGARVVSVGEKINREEYIYDIGPRTLDLFLEYAGKSQLLVWNGPLGKFENEKFSKGTFGFVKELPSFKKVVVGGGETSMVIDKFELEDKIYHLSTGGGAMLEFLEGKKMPGIGCLLNC